MKKLFAFLASALMVLSLAACSNNGGGNNDKPTDDGGAGTDKKVYNVGVSIYKFDDNFMTLYRKEIESYFKTLNTDEFEYKVTIQDGKGDMA